MINPCKICLVVEDKQSSRKILDVLVFLYYLFLIHDWMLSYVLDRRIILKYIELCNNNISIIHKKLQLSYHLLLMTTKNAQVIYLRLMCLKYYLNFSGWVVEWLSSYDLVRWIFKFLPPVINLLWSACCPFYYRALR